MIQLFLNYYFLVHFQMTHKITAQTEGDAKEQGRVWENVGFVINKTHWKHNPFLSFKT